METLSKYKTKHGREVELTTGAQGNFWLIEQTDFKKDIVVLDEFTAQKVAIAILKKLGHKVIKTHAL